MDFSHKLEEIRQITGSSQTEMAQKLGVSFVTLHNWLRGRTRPRPKAQQRIDSLYSSLVQKSSGAATLRLGSEQLAQVQVLLLIAGQSKRFWPLKEKPLFPICGRTLLEHQVARLQEAGLENIILVGSANNLEEIGGIYPRFRRVEQEDLSLGMRGALLSALPHCSNNPVMIVSGNDVFEPRAYASLLDILDTEDIKGALLAQQVSSYFPGGYLSLEGDRITSIIEKPGEGNEPSDLVNIVAHIHKDSRGLLDALQHVDESRDDGYEQALQKLFDAHTYKAIPYDGIWQAVKFPWHILELLPVLLEDIKTPQIDPSASIHPSAIVEGNVVIEEGARVFPHAVIKGPCYIGKHSIVANNALVRGSSVGDHCVVGYNTEIKSSVLARHVWTHMTYIGDSVVGTNVSFGAGCITGNLRLDEELVISMIGDQKIDTGLVKLGSIVGNDCRLGIQVGINPGVKIGSGSFISSGVMIAQDIPNEQFVRMKEGTAQMSDNRTRAPQPEEREKFRTKV